MSILELKDVCYSYSAEKPVLRGMNCTFECGTLYALVGKSGAGKSTLLSLMAGLDLPDELLDRYPTHISGGEQQRVAIARGLTMDRRLLLADEPTGNLDSENSDNIIDLLLRLAHEENRCVIVVTHDLTVMDRADVVYRISDGLLQRRQKEQ